MEKYVTSTLDRIRSMLSESETVQDFVSKMFETQEDGAIELYEFVDVILTVQALGNDAYTRQDVAAAMAVTRKHGIDRPWDTDEAMRPLYAAIRSVFKSLDTNRDGILDKKELYAF